jgi:outer membrane protein
MIFLTPFRFVKFSACTLTLALACNSQADTIFGIYAGAGTWQTEYDGAIGSPATSTNDLGVKDNNNNFYYVAIEHPIPFLPNIKLQQNNIRSNQTSTIDNSFSLGNINYPSGSNIASDFDLSYTDAALYYELLDNWLNLDLGVTLRKYSGYLQAESNSSSERINIDTGLPLAYARVQFDLPFTGFSAGLEGNYISYDGNDLTDYNAKISYLFDSSLDLGIEVGYRAVTANFDDGDVKTNLDMKGPYIAALFHF